MNSLRTFFRSICQHVLRAGRYFISAILRRKRPVILFCLSLLAWNYRTLFDGAVFVFNWVAVQATLILSSLANFEAGVIFFFAFIGFWFIFSKVRRVIEYGLVVQFWLFMFCIGCIFFILYYKLTRI